MSDEMKKDVKEELTDEETEQVTGAGSKICWKCGATVRWTTFLPMYCPYCKAILNSATLNPFSRA